jgi:hypothetical protein
MDSGFRRNDGFWTFDEFIKLRFLNSRELAIENGMFRMAVHRHCFFDSPQVS